ncbi:MAG TPA: BON domain-containing protein [Pirellulales bacterium]|jgi:osmotically-inducible protein OsmY|nr:BON domain-containing protein [Pirellulales bacterium]
MEVFTPGNDCVVTERANARLRMSAYSPVRQVACAFDKGVLVLRGRLRSFFHKQIAQETVANLEGVRQIRNEIEVFSLTG